MEHVELEIGLLAQIAAQFQQALRLHFDPRIDGREIVGHQPRWEDLLQSGVDALWRSWLIVAPQFHHHGRVFGRRSSDDRPREPSPDRRTARHTQTRPATRRRRRPNRASRPAPAWTQKMGSELSSCVGESSEPRMPAYSVRVRPRFFASLRIDSLLGLSTPASKCVAFPNTVAGGRKRPPRPQRSETPAPRRRIADRTAPTPGPRPARRTRRSSAFAAVGTWARNTFPNKRDASTNRNPTVANSAK